jgi:hypothetical protein
MIKTGSIWKDGFGLYFKVTAVASTGDETWIVYTKIGDPTSSYSCLEPAFLQRFNEHVNGSF